MQQDLFGSSDPESRTIKLDAKGQSWLLLYPGFYSPTKSTKLYQSLEADIPWQQDRIRIAGKERTIPRLQAWFGNANTRYGYSGLQLQPIPFSKTLATLKQDIEALAGDMFNSVLANLYRDGNDSVSWHADDEPELGQNPFIASLSLGSSRRFSLKHKSNKQLKPLHLDLNSGDLLIMGGTTQHHWLHQVPKTKQATGSRINLTFRKIYQK